MISTSNPEKKAVVIGLDGATFDIIRPMISRGKLKNFEKLMSSGSSGNLNSTIFPLSSVAWSSFVSGRNPAKHGMYDFSKRVPGSYEYAPVTSLDRGAKAIWDYASDAGKQCLIVNIPLTYPPEKLNGIMISGFPYPSSRRDFAYPIQVIDDIRKELGITSILKPNPQFLKDGDEQRIVDEVIKISRDQTEILKYLMRKERWDLVLSVFDAPDVVGHFFWHHLDPNHPKYNVANAKKYEHLVYDVYQELDGCLGEIMSMISKEDNLFVISDHGFGPVYYTVCINNWLLKNNYLKLKRGFGTRTRKALFDFGFTSEFLLSTVKKLHIVGTKTNTYSKKSKKIGLAKKLTLSTDDIDWNETRAYSAGNYGPIYVNLKGREPNGKVERGEEYENLVADLTAKLREFPDLKGTRPLFDIVYTKDKIYSGPFYDEAPDIIYFDSSWLCYPMRVFEFGNKKLIAPNPIYTGAHRMEGIFIAAGEDVRNQSLDNLNLVDMTPTILHIMGLNIPTDMDGRVLDQIFREESEYMKYRARYFEEKHTQDIRTVARSLIGAGKLI
ncbi:MAG TPA: alkaline phosphatase family protein [Nitrososphaerales archaeon]|nr:alkaline phosphatase family protein [Nitrososphaerales archaeon]